MRLICGIDAQISPRQAGGTETALLSLLSALAQAQGPERFLVMGLKQHLEELRPFTGGSQTLEPCQWTYSWYSPSKSAPAKMSARWHMMARGPLQPTVSAMHAWYHGGIPREGRALRVMENVGPLRYLVPPAYRVYRDWQGWKSRNQRRDRLDAQLRSKGVSVLHFPYPHHIDTAIPFVYEPWGLPHIHQPEAFQADERVWMDALWRDGCDKATVIVTATRWVKNDLVKQYGVPRDKIAVIPRLPQQGIAGHAGRGADPQTATALTDIPPIFALFPAMTWPTKNHLRLLEALTILRDRFGIRLQVLCTGRLERSHWPKIEHELERSKLKDQVRFLGSIPLSDLQTLFRKARFLIFPTLFEGLGLPVLEAFQHRLPVVTSNAACIPEVVGDAAIVFDPYDTSSIALAMKQALEDDILLAGLRERGVRRLEEGFPSPEKMADMFITVYRWASGATLSREQAALKDEMLGD